MELVDWNEVDIQETNHIDAAADAHQQEHEEQEINDNGFCFHCGETLTDCSGYKCWVR